MPRASGWASRPAAPAVELLESVASPRWRQIYLTHLSRECNSPAAVELAFAALRSRLSCQFSVVTSGGGTPFYEFT